MGELQITSEQVNGVLVVRLAGAPHLQAGAPMQELVSSTVDVRPEKVVIDLSGLEYISSLVAGRLVAMQTFLKRQGGRAVIAGANQMVKDALVKMRVVTMIPIVDTIEQALALAPQDDITKEPPKEKRTSLFSSGR
jgi:anti-anti-sigma factor